MYIQIYNEFQRCDNVDNGRDAYVKQQCVNHRCMLIHTLIQFDTIGWLEKSTKVWCVHIVLPSADFTFEKSQFEFFTDSHMLATKLNCPQYTLLVLSWDDFFFLKST